MTQWKLYKLASNEIAQTTSYLSHVTEFKGDRNINYVLVESSALHLTPPTIYAGRRTLKVTLGSVQIHLPKAKCLLVQGNEPYLYSTSLRPHGMHGIRFVWLQHMQTKVPQYSTKYINFITGSSTIRGTTLDHNITGIHKVSLLSAHSGSNCV